MPKQIIAIPAQKPTLYKTNTYITRRLNAQIITSKKLKKRLKKSLTYTLDYCTIIERLYGRTMR